MFLVLKARWVVGLLSMAINSCETQALWNKK